MMTQKDTDLLRILSNYLYSEIDWDYSQLTMKEKRLISFENFKYLKENFAKR